MARLSPPATAPRPPAIAGIGGGVPREEMRDLARAFVKIFLSRMEAGETFDPTTGRWRRPQ